MTTPTPTPPAREEPPAPEVGFAPAAGLASGQRAAEHGREQVAGFVYASIWLVFLAVPIIAAFTTDTAWWERLLVCAATAIFGVVYCCGAWAWFTTEESAPSSRALLVLLVVLGAIAAATIPLIGTFALAYTAYLAALVIFTRPPLVGVPVGVLLWAVPSVIGLLLTETASLWVAGGPGIGMLFIVALRIAEYYETKGRLHSEQLRAAEERSSIARDVHDVLGHSLTVLHVKAQLARRMMESDPERARAELDQIESLSRQALGEVRSTVTRLRAPELPGELEVSRTTLESAGISARITDGLGEASPAPAALAWALREGVTNVVRHSEANRCEIEISPRHLRIADDGTGIGARAEGNGLRGLRERAAAEGANVVVGRAYPELEGTGPERPGTLLEVSIR
ncbi:sensor histidine kinase [Nesterenkonia lacusekhoensis]|uniref:Two-component system sensor histidine kinase DesK n=1 Tax=Nesterenkonia lacusekhoensis TaxID=150832 RepID=A0ABS4SZJ2_9MICC|nr:histidine kinase [Nesterenkonia lacusekhoensis]MBP2317628.1 two-component system sensor histidine kinase DesK [Nesterenkonia lacusekhoensis]